MIFMYPTVTELIRPGLRPVRKPINFLRTARILPREELAGSESPNSLTSLGRVLKAEQAVRGRNDFVSSYSH
jgi:hypothetical protein